MKKPTVLLIVAMFATLPVAHAEKCTGNNSFSSFVKMAKSLVSEKKRSPRVYLYQLSIAASEAKDKCGCTRAYGKNAFYSCKTNYVRIAKTSYRSIAVHKFKKLVCSNLEDLKIPKRLCHCVKYVECSNPEGLYEEHPDCINHRRPVVLGQVPRDCRTDNANLFRKDGKYSYGFVKSCK